MSVSDPSPQLRVAVAGLGGRGLHYLERWLDSPAIRVTAAYDRDPVALEPAANLCERRTTDLGHLLSDSEIDAVALAVPTPERAALARRILAAGKHLVADPPLAETLDETQSVFDIAETSGRRIALWSPWREEPDFVAARSVLRSGLMGRPRLLRFERWEPTIDVAAPLPRPVVYLLDQLVALADEPAEAVYAARTAATGRIVTVSYASGLRAVLILHAAASTRIDHGWALDAERGGYTAGRRWVGTDEGELYEVPAEASPPSTLEDSLVITLNAAEPPASRTEALRLAALLTAVERSAETGQAAGVEPTP